MLTEFDWSGWPEGYGRVLLDQADSTMAEAARRAPDLAGPCWVLARRQTAGRGRRGRPWRDGHGSFAATLVLPRPGTPEQAALRSFVAALALYDTLANVVPPAQLALKWPNDVLLGGGKVAGILLESAGKGGAVDWLSIGIGINLTQAPTMAELEPGAVPPTCVAEHSQARLPVEGVLHELASAFALHEDRFTAYGFGPIRQLWLQRAARLGEAITVRTGAQTLKGVFEGLDEAGNLILASDSGRRAIAAAEVFF